MILLLDWCVYFLCFKIDSLFVCLFVLFRNHDNERQVLTNDGVDPGKQGTTRKTILQNLKLENKYLQIWNMMFVVSCTIAVSVDPLFFYLPLINEENKCLALDNKLKMAAICLRSVTDMVYVMNIILQFLCPYIDEAPLKLGRTVIVTDAWRIAKRYLLSYYLIDILAILPIPQVRETLLLLKCVYFFPSSTARRIKYIFHASIFTSKFLIPCHGFPSLFFLVGKGGFEQ